MAGKPIRQIMAGVPPSDPATKEKYHKWLEDVHVPDVFKYKGFKRYWNCRLTKAPGFQPLVTDYPEYLSIGEYNNQTDLDAFFDSPEIKYAGEDGLKTWGPEIGRTKKWLANYEESRCLRRELPANGNRMIQLVSGVPPEDKETAEKFYHWLDEEHIPEMFNEVKGIVSGGNYRNIPVQHPFPPEVTRYPYLVTMLEFNSRADMESLPKKPPVPGPWSNVGYEKIWFATYEVVKYWER